MKQGIKQIITGILVLVMGVSSVVCTQTSNIYAAGDIYTEALDIDSYKDGTVPKAKDSEHKDWVFAGWFTTADCTTAVDRENATGKQFAKFVPAEILSVQCQVLDNTNSTTPYTKIRLVSTVDSTQYKKVGFKYQIDQKAEMTYTTKTVYKSIEAKEGGVNISYSPSDFHSNAEYFTTVTITKIPSSKYGTGIRITPYWVTLDGTEVHGVSRYCRVEDSYLNIVNVPVRLSSDKLVSAGCLNLKYNTNMYQYYGCDAGMVFDEVKTNVSGNTVYCVGSSDVAKSVTADGMYVNLRFKLNANATKPTEDVIFAVNEEDFCNNQEQAVTLDVSDVVYKIIQQ